MLSENLPEIYKSLYFFPDIKDRIRLDLWGDSVHNWYSVPANEILNSHGLMFFKNVNHVNIFRCKANSIGPVHIDKQTDTAVNWIIQGEGVQQWFDPSTCIVLRYNRAGNEIYDVSNAKIVHETNSKFMRVNTLIPHRIVCTSDIDRICISVRTSCQF